MPTASRPPSPQPEPADSAQARLGLVKLLERLPIRGRLFAVILAATLSVLGIGVSVLLYWDYRALQHQAMDHAEFIRLGLNQQFVRILSLDRLEIGADASASLAAFADLRHAYLYDAAGQAVYRYQHFDAPPLPAPQLATAQPQGWSRFSSAGLEVMAPLDYQQRRLGSVYLHLAPSVLEQWVQDIRGLLLALMPGLLLLSLFLSYLFQALFTKPVLQLSAAVRGIAQDADFSRRVPCRAGNEIGELAQGINQMLDEIGRVTRELEEERQAINLAAIVSATDINGRIIYANDRFCQISGYRRDELVGANHNIVQSGYHTPRFYREMLASLRAGQVWKGEICNMDQSGEYYWEDATLVPFLDAQGQPRKFLGIRFPITERKNAEHKLLTAQQTLSLQVKQRTGELEASREQLVESEKLAALGGLVAGIAHEINTPLGVGVTAASHLQEEIKELQRQMADNRITKRSLQTFIDNVGEGSRILLSNLERGATLVRSFKQVASDQSHHEKREFALQEYLGEILLSLRPQLKKLPHQVRLEVPEDLVMDSYPGALSQIITNLVTNSLRYAFEPETAGEILIRAEGGGERLILEYSDNGCGIPPAHMKRIFEPFFTTGRATGGTGIGLHIVYNLATQTLGGKLQCDSAPGAGTRFRFDLPLDPDPEAV